MSAHPASHYPRPGLLVWRSANVKLQKIFQLHNSVLRIGMLKSHESRIFVFRGFELVAHFQTLTDFLFGFLLFLELTFGIVEVHVRMVFKELLEVTGYWLSMSDADGIIGCWLCVSQCAHIYFDRCVRC